MRDRKTSPRSESRPLRIEPLEQRALLSATAVFDHIVCDPVPRGRLRGQPRRYSSPPSAALTPAQIQTAYGINAISLGGVAGTGSGQTIAIVDAYDDPNIVSDAAAFNTQFGLQQFNVSGGPTLSVLNQTGGTSLPGARTRACRAGRWRNRSTWNGRTPSPPRPTSSSSRPTAFDQTCLPRSRRPRTIPASPWFR